MGKALLLLAMISAYSFSDIYQNGDGWIFSETALLSAPSPESDTLAVFSPGTLVTRTVTQHSSYLTEADLEPFLHPFEFTIRGHQVQSYPESLLPPGAEGLELIPVSFSSEPSDFTHLILAFAFPEGWLPLDTLLSPGDINTAKFFAQWMEETGTLKVYPYGTMSSSFPIHTWHRDSDWKFSLITEEIRDVAAITYASMDSQLAQGAIMVWSRWSRQTGLSDLWGSGIGSSRFLPWAGTSIWKVNSPPI